MKRINNTDIWQGNMYDYEDIRGGNSWAVVHCCKNPYHQELVGYKGNKLSSSHPNYLYCEQGNRFAINIIDTNIYQADYLWAKKKQFKAAFDFIDRQLDEGRKVLIHCNAGLSRSPVITVAYLASRGIDGYGEMPFLIALNRFSSENGIYIEPKNDILRSVNEMWEELIKEGDR